MHTKDITRRGRILAEAQAAPGPALDLTESTPLINNVMRIDPCRGILCSFCLPSVCSCLRTHSLAPGHFSRPPRRSLTQTQPLSSMDQICIQKPTCNCEKSNPNTVPLLTCVSLRLGGLKSSQFPITLNAAG